MSGHRVKSGELIVEPQGCTRPRAPITFRRAAGEGACQDRCIQEKLVVIGKVPPNAVERRRPAVLAGGIRRDGEGSTPVPLPSAKGSPTVVPAAGSILGGFALPQPPMLAPQAHRARLRNWRRAFCWPRRSVSPRDRRAGNRPVMAARLPGPQMPSIGHRHLVARCGTVGLVALGCTTRSGRTAVSETCRRPITRSSAHPPCNGKGRCARSGASRPFPLHHRARRAQRSNGL